MAHDVFISYAQEDRRIAEAVCAALEARGIRCWIAPRDIRLGQDFGEAIVDAIEESRLMVLVLSADANLSHYVKNEVEVAVSEAKPILPLQVADVAPSGPLAHYLSEAHCLDASTPPLDQHVQGLVDAVKRMCRPVAKKRPPESWPIPSADAPDEAREVTLPAGFEPESEQPPIVEPVSTADADDEAQEVGSPLAITPDSEPPPIAEPVSTADAMETLRATPSHRASRPPDRSSADAPPADPVDCTVFAPPTAYPDATLFIQVFAHIPEQAAEAEEMATQFDDEADRRAFKSLQTDVERGSTLQFHLAMPGLTVDDPVQQLTWQGRTESVQFGARVPESQRVGSIIATVTVSQDSVPIGHVKFKLKIVQAVSADEPPTSEPVGEQARRYQLALISYASSDRPKVLAHIQMLKAVGIRYFQDILDLGPGDRWEAQLYRHIDKCDLFLLFWSSAARDSEWVLKEV
ncbi:MAG: TIR domain-containing protein, partial [Armatimonadota bacterium]